jgi:hypothetical protein
MAVLSLQDQLLEKERQLAELKRNLSLGSVQSVQPIENPSISIDDIQKLIDEGVSKKLSEMGGLSSSKEEIVGLTQQEEVAPKEYTLFEAINLSLTGEEQQWFSSLNVVQGVANFFATEEGKFLVKQFIKDYREYYGKIKH